MGCCKPSSSRSSKTKTSKNMEPATWSSPQLQQSTQEPKDQKQELLLQIPACTLHLVEGGEAVELSRGDFKLVQILEQNVPLATIVRVGDDIQWPLTKDEPVVKLDKLHYLFSLPMKDGDPLSYGVTFLDHDNNNNNNNNNQYINSSLGFLDSFLNEHSCFSYGASGGENSYNYYNNKNNDSNGNNNHIDWKEFAPSVEDYNNFLAKAIAGGTGQIVKGIFKCSNAYTNQVHKGGEMILTRAAEEKNGYTSAQINAPTGPAKMKKVNRSLKRVRKLSKMTEKLSKTMLDGVGIVSGTVMAPVVKSQPGKAFLSMVPGEVILASLDAVNKILDAAEAAEKQALSATSKATAKIVSNRFGENAGEATEDVFATAGHCASTAWNIFKIRKALNPSSSVTSGVLKNAAKSTYKNKS